MTDSSKETINRPPVFKILLWISPCLLGIYAILRILYTTQGVSLWFLGGTAEEINHWLHFFGIVFLLVGGGITLIRRHRPFRILLTLLLILLLICAICLQIFTAFLKIDTVCTTITSPDGKHSLVIHEQSILLFSVSTVYEKIAPGVLKEIGHFYSDDGIKPLAQKQCEILWDENGVTFLFDPTMTGNDEEYFLFLKS